MSRKYNWNKKIFIWISMYTLFAVTLSFASDIELRLQEAKSKAVAKHFEEAVTIYDEILMVAPQNIEALNGKARILGWMGKYDDAEKVYEEVFSSHPENIEANTGLADLSAWQGDYLNAIDRLKAIGEKYPDNRDIFIRMAKYHLWAGQKQEAIHFADKILAMNPADTDAIGIREKASMIYHFESSTDYRYLYMDRNGTGDLGHNLYTGLAYLPNEPFKLHGQLEYLDRFEENEVKFSVGGSYQVKNDIDISVEAGFAPGAEIFPLFSGRTELAYTMLPALVIYGGPTFSHYSNVDLYGFSVAGEYYPYGWLSILARVSILRSDFEEAGSSSDTAFFSKVTWLATDTNKLFIYFSSGSEAYQTETIDSIGNVEAKAYGIGGTYFIAPSWGLSPSFEFQDRQGGTRYYQSGLEFTYRW